MTYAQVTNMAASGNNAAAIQSLDDRVTAELASKLDSALAPATAPLACTRRPPGAGGRAWKQHAALCRATTGLSNKADQSALTCWSVEHPGRRSAGVSILGWLSFIAGTGLRHVGVSGVSGVSPPPHPWLDAVCQKTCKIAVSKRGWASQEPSLFRLRILRRTRSNAGRTSAGSLSGRI